MSNSLPIAPSEAPLDVRALNVQSRLIELAWSPPPTHALNGEIVHYIVTYKDLETGLNTTVTSFTTVVMLGNLHPFYNYSITVAAYTVATGPSSTPLHIQTLEDGEQKSIWYLSTFNFFFLVPGAPPTDISAITPNATTLIITWQPPDPAYQNGIIRSYMVTVFSLESDSSEQLTSNELHIVLYNLHPFYTYSFLIAAVTVGSGPFSDTFSIQMPQAGKLATKSCVYFYTIYLNCSLF